MAQEKKFILEAIKRAQIEDFLSKEFSRAGYSHIEIQRTPLAMRITIYAHKPGLIIGRGGKKIDMITEVLKNKFNFENPQLDVQEVEEPNLDPCIVMSGIAGALERGLNYKRVGNLTIQRIMGAGAVGAAIKLSGKVGGERGRTEKFSAGYLKYAGFPAEEIVRKASTRAELKLGTVGIEVRILTELPKEKQMKEIKKEEPKEKVEEVKEKPKEEKKDGNNKKETVKRDEKTRDKEKIE